jgi:mannose-6-phosphate isomerase-like protein (cupin superfamily)
MERRDFVMKAGLMSALAGLAGSSFGKTIQHPLEESLKPVLLPPAPPLDHKGGMDIKVWVRSAMTGGVYSNVECAVAPKTMGPAPHYHLELDELMYVVDGTASVLIGDDVVHIEAGGWHLRPRMIKHTFFNASDKPLRFFDMYFNQPFEEYLEAVFHNLTPENGYPRGSQKFKDEMGKLTNKFGLKRYDNAEEEKQSIMKQFKLK